MPYKVKLEYFKPSGKWYSDGVYTSNAQQIYEIIDEVREMINNNHLPGLIPGHSDFSVYIDIPDHPHRHPVLLHPIAWQKILIALDEVSSSLSYTSVSKI